VSSASQDVRYALRQLRRNPGFTLTAVVTMGLGIGATAAIFSAVYSLLLRPLPYQDANQIMSVSDAHSAPLIDPDFVAARTGTRSFQQLAGFHTYTQAILTGVGDPVRVTRAAVTANFFPVLGVVPALGHNFNPDEDWSGHQRIALRPENCLGIDRHLYARRRHAPRSDLLLGCMGADDDRSSVGERDSRLASRSHKPNCRSSLGLGLRLILRKLASSISGEAESSNHRAEAEVPGPFLAFE
jgi:hypothetical protein